MPRASSAQGYAFADFLEQVLSEEVAAKRGLVWTRHLVLSFSSIDAAAPAQGLGSPLIDLPAPAVLQVGPVGAHDVQHQAGALAALAAEGFA